MDLSDLPTFRDRLHRILTHRARNPDLADDLCQSALLKSLAYSVKHGELPEPGYIVQCGLNELYSLHRRRCPKHLADGFDRPVSGSDPSEALDTVECSASEAALDALPSRYREAARLRFVDGWPELEIARRLALNINTVKTRVARAKAMLRKRLRLHYASS